MPEALVHALSGVFRPGSLDDASWNTDSRAPGRNGFGHQRTGCDLGIGSDLDIADDLGPCADQDAGSDLWVAIGFIRSGASERNSMQYRDTVFDHSRLACHKACCMVEEYAFAELRARMDVGLENLG